MRLWSLHPSHLDRMGLLACWREALLAQAVLAGRTRGYLRHPQLERFRSHAEPLCAIGAYLGEIASEATRRGYRFDRSRILELRDPGALQTIAVTDGQLRFEWLHLEQKLRGRSPDDAARWRTAMPTPHPLFRVVQGDLAPWERVTSVRT